MLSLLMWECGLKLTEGRFLRATRESLLMWECGLKRMIDKVLSEEYDVTPYVGVWIETTEKVSK